MRLPDEPVSDRNASDLIAQVELQAFKNWSVGMGLQWDHGKTRASAKSEVRLQLPARARSSVVNLGYRFQRDRLEQADVSAAWPISDHWRLYGRTLYSLRDEQGDRALRRASNTAAAAGACGPWPANYVSRRSGERDRSIYLQLELKGLSSVGMAADAFLERAIRGYSRTARRRDATP